MKAGTDDGRHNAPVHMRCQVMLKACTTWLMDKHFWQMTNGCSDLLTPIMHFQQRAVHDQQVQLENSDAVHIC